MGREFVLPSQELEEEKYMYIWSQKHRKIICKHDTLPDFELQTQGQVGKYGSRKQADLCP
jgi:hypothetical protein